MNNPRIQQTLHLVLDVRQQTAVNRQQTEDIRQQILEPGRQRNWALVQVCAARDDISGW